MIFGPKADGTYVVEFRTAEGEALAISIPQPALGRCIDAHRTNPSVTLHMRVGAVQPSCPFAVRT